MRDISFHYGQEPLYSCFFGIPEFLAETNKRCNPRSSNLQINPKPGKKAYRRKKERHSCVCVCVCVKNEAKPKATHKHTHTSKQSYESKQGIPRHPVVSIFQLSFDSVCVSS